MFIPLYYHCPLFFYHKCTQTHTHVLFITMHSKKKIMNDLHSITSSFIFNLMIIIIIRFISVRVFSTSLFFSSNNFFLLLLLAEIKVKTIINIRKKKKRYIHPSSITTFIQIYIFNRNHKNPFQTLQ